MRRRSRGPVVAVLVLAALVAGTLWWRAGPHSDLERAVALAPPEAQRLSWTDWAGVRDELGATLSADSPVGRLRSFLDRGFEADLTSSSALLQSAPTLQARYGFSPASVDWELFSQSSQGAVVILHLPDDTDFDALGDGFEELGYTRPDDDTGVWDGGPDVVTRIAADLTPELQYLALDAADGLVLASDTAGYLREAVGHVRGDDRGDGGGAGGELAHVATASGGALNAAIYDSDHACSQLAMGQADPADQEQAAQLLAGAGKVNPVTGFAMSNQPGGHVRVVLSFENDEQARTNADTRAALAAGPAPGQGGDFSDRFEVASTTAEGRDVVLDLVPKQGTYVLSDLSTGPLLFATC